MIWQAPDRKKNDFIFYQQKFFAQKHKMHKNGIENTLNRDNFDENRREINSMENIVQYRIDRYNNNTCDSSDSNLYNDGECQWQAYRMAQSTNPTVSFWLMQSLFIYRHKPILTDAEAG